MSLRTSLPLIASMVLLACGGGTPPADHATPEGSASAGAPTEAPSASPSAKEEAKTDAPGEKPAAKPAEAAKAPKLDKPKSEATIAGKSLSELDDAGLSAELKKLGWVKEGAAVSGGTVGSYQSLSVDIEKGKAKGVVKIIRPAAEPGEASGTSIAPPSEQKAEREKEGAATELDEAADVLVIVQIEGKTADAKKLLAQLVKVAHAKAAPKPTAKTEKTPAAKTPPKAPPAAVKTAKKK